MKKLLITVVVLVVVGLSATAVVWTQSRNTIGEVNVTPTFVVVDEPTEVLFTARIDSPLVIPTGVNLLKVDASGKTLAIAGTMRDNGTNGDAVAGDKVFSLRLTLSEATAGEMHYRVSAAFRGTLRRVLSPSIVVVIRIDPFLLPPDPGELGKLTLEGIDSDGDGIRDDLQRWIALSYSDASEDAVRRGLRQLARSYQRSIALTNAASAGIAVAEELAAARCLFSILGPVAADEVVAELATRAFNTAERQSAYLDFLTHGRELIPESPPAVGLAEFCTVDP